MYDMMRWRAEQKSVIWPETARYSCLRVCSCQHTVRDCRQYARECCPMRLRVVAGGFSSDRFLAGGFSNSSNPWVHLVSCLGLRIKCLARDAKQPATMSETCISVSSLAHMRVVHKNRRLMRDVHGCHATTHLFEKLVCMRMGKCLGTSTSSS